MSPGAEGCGFLLSGGRGGGGDGRGGGYQRLGFKVNGGGD